MGRSFLLCLATFTLVATATAQKLHPCAFSGTSTIGQSEKITIQRVALIEKKTRVEATIFIPNGTEPLPGIVFTHSAIHGSVSNTDLLRFAWALARAGAASIILDGAIEWQAPNDDSIRPTEFQFCAAQWLFQNVNLDLHRLANAGNFHIGWIPDDLSQCGIETSGKARCWPGGLDVGFGQTSPVESRNTDFLLTPEGEMRIARVIQKELGLKEIDPAWFTETPDSLTKVVAAASNRQLQQQP